LEKLAKGNKTAKSLGRRDIIGLQAGGTKIKNQNDRSKCKDFILSLDGNPD
jgi:hypothetical protein